MQDSMKGTAINYRDNWGAFTHDPGNKKLIHTDDEREDKGILGDDTVGRSAETTDNRTVIPVL